MFVTMFKHKFKSAILSEPSLSLSQFFHLTVSSSFWAFSLARACWSWGDFILAATSSLIVGALCLRLWRTQFCHFSIVDQFQAFRNFYPTAKRHVVVMMRLSLFIILGIPESWNYWSDMYLFVPKASIKTGHWYTVRKSE